LVACLLLRMALRAFAATLPTTHDPASTDHATPASGIWGLLQQRYLVLIFLTYMLLVLTYYCVDFLFLVETKQHYKSEAELANFLGPFSGTVEAMTFLGRTFLSGRVMNRYGLRGGLLAHPVLLTFYIVAIAVVSTTLGSSGLLFGLVALTKLSDEVLWSSLTDPSCLLLYQPLRAQQRFAAQVAVQGIFAPLAVALAGLMLLLIGSGDTLNPVALLLLVLPILAASMLMAVLVSRGYVSALTNALTRRTLEGTALSLDDSASRAVLQQKLQSPYTGEVLYALDMLDRLDHQALAPSLAMLLAHPEAAVRQDVLQRIERGRVSSALVAVRQRAMQESAPQVRAAALRAWCSLGEPDMVTQLAPLVHTAAPAVQVGAMVGLLQYGGLEGVLVAGERLLAMAQAPEPLLRQTAAQVLGEVGVRHFYQPLLSLLHDSHPEVRRAALGAAGRVQNPHLWPQVVAQLTDPMVCQAAVSALSAGGTAVLPDLAAAYTASTASQALRIRIARLCGRMRHQAAIAFLLEHLDRADSAVRSSLLASLSLCGYRPHAADLPRFQQCLKDEIAAATWTLAALADIGDSAPVALLRRALEYALEQIRRRLFFYLSFLYEAEAVLRARDYLAHPEAEKRAYALEILDILLAQEVKTLLLPLCEELTMAERLQRLQPFFPQPVLTCEARLQALMAHPESNTTAWVRACALYAMAQLSERQGDMPMLLTLEKVIILKTVSIFAETPDEILAEVASLLAEVEVPAHTTILHKGEMGSCMYIIVDGRVRVHDGDHTLAFLGDRDIFGELAVLDPEARSASVTALEDTRLFRLDQEAFYELMADRIEVVRGIIRVLCQRVRGRAGEEPTQAPAVPTGAAPTRAAGERG